MCAGNPRRVSCAIKILSFQNFYEVLKTCSAGRKEFFDTLKREPKGSRFFGLMELDQCRNRRFQKPVEVRNRISMTTGTT